MKTFTELEEILFGLIEKSRHIKSDPDVDFYKVVLSNFSRRFDPYEMLLTMFQRICEAETTNDKVESENV